MRKGGFKVRHMRTFNTMAMVFGFGNQRICVHLWYVPGIMSTLSIHLEWPHDSMMVQGCRLMTIVLHFLDASLFLLCLDVRGIQFIDVEGNIICWPIGFWFVFEF